MMAGAMKTWVASLLVGALLLVGCSGEGAGVFASEPTPPAVDAATTELMQRARTTLGTLPNYVANEANPRNDAKVDLGRMLYYDARLSKNHDVSCNSCHMLDAFGVDGEPTSPGNRGQRGDRTRPPPTTLRCTSPSSGTGGHPTSKRRLAARSSTRSRWRCRAKKRFSPARLDSGVRRCLCGGLPGRGRR